ncbi:MAG: DUF6152 family protein [Polyangiales bacterium]
MKQLHMTQPALAALAAAWLIASPVAAHHSFAMYDATQLVSLVGTVKEFQWTNPHVILWVTKDAPPGQEPELWTVELPTSTGNLSRMSWSKHSLAAGDRVTVEMNPLRDGQHGGSFKKVTIAASGKVLTASAPATPDAGTAPQPSAAPAPTTPAASQSGSGCGIVGGRTPAASWALWLASGCTLFVRWRLTARRLRTARPEPRAHV